MTSPGGRRYNSSMIKRGDKLRGAVFFLFLLSVPILIDAHVWKNQRNLGPGGSSAIILDKRNSLHVLGDATGIYHRKSLDGGETWTGAKELGQGLNQSHKADIAVGPDNGLYVVFESSKPGKKLAIFYVKSTDGGQNWTLPKRITWQKKDSGEPHIVVDSANRIHVVWFDYIPGEMNEESFCEFYHIKSEDGGKTWTKPKELARCLWATGLEMVVNSKGTLFVFMNFATLGTKKYGIYYVKSKNGGSTWTSLKTPDSHPNGSFELAIGTDNTLHLIWKNRRNYPEIKTIYLKSEDGGLTWSQPKKIATQIHVNQIEWLEPDFEISLDSDNNPHVMYSDEVTGNLELYHKMSADGGDTWTKSQRITVTPIHSRTPRMVLDLNDIIHLTWGELNFISQEEHPQNVYYIKGAKE